MTPTEERVVRYLAACPRTPARDVAKALWPDSKGWSRATHRHDGRAGAYGGTMPMRAGRVLESMRERGLVVVSYSFSGQALWSASLSGVTALGVADDFADEGLTT